jgi:spermidine synthase
LGAPLPARPARIAGAPSPLLRLARYAAEASEGDDHIEMIDTENLTRAAPAPVRPHEPERLRLAGLFAFVGSGCLLVLELVAGRILAPTLGVSLYTWTSIIGVVLAGVSLGNYLGGRIADRWPGRRTLSSVYILSAIASALVLLLSRDLEALAAPHSVSAVLQVIWLTTVLFFVPSTLLAMATPMLVKLSLASLGNTGRVVGRIQAAATLGSIVGTFATGFFLISLFGTRAIIAGVAGALLVLGAAVYPLWTRRRIVDLTAVALVIGALSAVAGAPCLRESNYYCIRVVDSGPHVKALVLDSLVHGFVDIEEPTKLLYPYEKLYEEALGHAGTPSGQAMFAIGGGTYTFPRYASRILGADVLVAEIDPEVTAVARSHLGLEDSPGLRIVHDDARRVLLRLPAGERFDVVLGDAFNDAGVPFHLTTREFNELLARHLNPDGLYLVNVVDSVRYDFLRTFVGTLKLTFPHVGVLSSSSWPPAGGRDTFVVAASRDPLTVSPSMISQHALDDFLARPWTPLTDDRVPVDQLLAPVFRQRLEG